ncbi:unnamed protein product [Ceratitis capitata]|uniref:(Mediterranean fruit fly) hypothetical protein n=1 Tax=Ceratitis capitata TaxID=7213 RepID=A0A811U216_CERCA|nr:unnamed protein product [Ceratitis capitata]
MKKMRPEQRVVAPSNDTSTRLHLSDKRVREQTAKETGSKQAHNTSLVRERHAACNTLSVTTGGRGECWTLPRNHQRHTFPRSQLAVPNITVTLAQCPPEEESESSFYSLLQPTLPAIVATVRRVATLLPH